MRESPSASSSDPAGEISSTHAIPLARPSAPPPSTSRTLTPTPQRQTAVLPSGMPFEKSAKRESRPDNNPSRHRKKAQQPLPFRPFPSSDGDENAFPGMSELSNFSSGHS